MTEIPVIVRDPDYDGLPDKRCFRCKQTKPATDFYFAVREIRRLYANCRVCEVKRMAKWRKDNAQHVISRRREHWLAKTYDVSVDEYDTLLDEQNGRCASCGVSASDLSKRLAVDHCHETGTVRGLLCTHCNIALGHLKDDPSRIRSLAAYIERSLVGT